MNVEGKKNYSDKKQKRNQKWLFLKRCWITVKFKVMKKNSCLQFTREKKCREWEERERKPRGGVTGWEKEERARTALLFIHFWKCKKNTIALRLQQPTAYKPMSEESCQTVFHTESSDPLSQRPAVQCSALQTVLLWMNWLFQYASNSIKRETS